MLEYANIIRWSTVLVEFHRDKAHAKTVETRPFFLGLGTRQVICMIKEWLFDWCIQRFAKFLQCPVARARTVPSNQIAKRFKFCSLIGPHG